jgi:hypothetical protein
MTATRISTLRLALRAAAKGKLGRAWLYLPKQEELYPETPCLLVDDDNEDSSAVAAAIGFPVEGLDAPTLHETAEWARALHDPPSDELLLESFAYYLKFDAWLPHPGAPDPTAWDETKRSLDREFYDGLGPESPHVSCRKPGCVRGAIEFSVMCRPHHFEMLRRESCPFVD